MTHDPIRHPKSADPADALARLERMHERAKEKQAAWRKLLEQLEALKRKDLPENPADNETPST